MSHHNLYLTNQILLSPWTNPPANIGLLTNLSLLDTLNDSNTLASIPVSTVIVGNSCKVTGESVVGTINLKTGALKVTIGSGRFGVTGYGAILLDDLTNSGGYYLTKTNAQAIRLVP